MHGRLVIGECRETPSGREMTLWSGGWQCGEEMEREGEDI